MDRFESNKALDWEYRVRRNAVEDGEHMVSAFLDKYFYPLWTTTLTRYPYDDPRQIQGLDITVQCDGVDYTIDEKASVRWIGKHLSSFSQEISSVNAQGYEYDGWLLDFNSVSDYLLEVFVDEVKDGGSTLKDPEDITDLTAVLIKKTDLWRWMKEHGISSADLRDIAAAMRRDNTSSRWHKGYKVVLNHKIREKVANILIPRDELIKDIAVMALRIKDKDIESLK